MSDRPMTVADIVDAAAKGKIGHSDAIRRLGLSCYNELVETMRLNGRSLWAHRSQQAPIDRETLDILRRACAPPQVVDQTTEE